jgi:hypothetical protein
VTGSWQRQSAVVAGGVASLGDGVINGRLRRIIYTTGRLRPASWRYRLLPRLSEVMCSGVFRDGL